MVKYINTTSTRHKRKLLYIRVKFIIKDKRFLRIFY